MDVRLAIAVLLVSAAAAAAWFIERRRPRAPADALTTGTGPARLAREDFPRSDAPWLVVLFSSATCDSCGPMAEKVRVLDSEAVATCEIEYSVDRALHERYRIDAVPLVVIADADGVVTAAFVGRTSATDLWAAVAEVRDPGSTPEPGLGTPDAP